MLFRLFKYSIKNILRNKFLSFSSVIVLSLLMFFVNILFIMHNLSNNLIETINSKLTISLYLKDEYGEDSFEVKRLKEDISNKLPQIILEYKSKDEVLEEMRAKDEELVNIIRGHNPLPATINISNIKMEEYEELNYIIESKLYILSDFRTGSIYDYNSQYERIMKIVGILQTLKLGLYVIIGVFLLSIFIITYSIIGNFIYYYRDEISITKLVGGSDAFIYGPFMFQGIIYSILGFLFSFNIFLLIIKNITFIFDRKLISEYVFNTDLTIVFFIQLIIFIIIGAFSSYLGAKKYIK